jgi:ABC-type sugar transport system, ATPase component
MIPEERKVKGLFLDHDVKTNINISILKKLRNGIMLSKKKEVQNADRYVKKLNIKTPTIDREIKFLSGGNQQKSIIGRWLSVDTKILILDEPTHGIDVGAKAEIYELINDLANSGVGIILISSEMVELLSLCDRIAVMRKGTISMIMDEKDVTQEEIMKYAIL